MIVEESPTKPTPPLVFCEYLTLQKMRDTFLPHTWAP